MIRIRPYKASDADTILSWCQDEKITGVFIFCNQMDYSSA